MQTGVLLLHGFAGRPADVAPFKEYLLQNGYTVSAPVLPGHNSTRAELGKAKYTDWLTAAEDAAVELGKSCDRLVLAGFSMGGLLCVNLCDRVGAKQLVLVNTPVYYWDVKRIALNLVSDFPAYSRKYLTAAIEKPFPVLLEFLKILNMTKPLFSTVRCPAVIVQTKDDDTVRHKSADFIFGQLRGKRMMKQYEKGGHLVFLSPSGSTVCADIVRMLQLME
jgi:carboxylesterase